MTVKARMQCSSLTYFETGSEVNLQAVYGKGKGNEDFAKATPSGTLKMMITKGYPAATAFVPGKYYDITFNESEIE